MPIRWATSTTAGKGRPKQEKLMWKPSEAPIWVRAGTVSRAPHCVLDTLRAALAQFGRSHHLVTRSAASLAAGVPDQRPATEVDAARIRAALAGVRATQEAVEKAVAEALVNGASVRMVAG